MDNLHWEIISELGEQNIEYEIKFDIHEEQYNNMKKLINTKMWSVAHRAKSTPRLDVPVFNGNCSQWVSFKDLFTEAIHNKNSLSDAQKMQFLKSKVRGEAERLIQHLPISTENYASCWNILNNRFNNIKLIFTTHMNTLLGFSHIQQQSGGQLKKMHDVTVETLNAIKNLDVDLSTWDPILVHLLSQKLDSDTHADYIASLKNPRELPILQEFLDFLEGKFIALESSRRNKEKVQHKPLPHNREPQHKNVYYDRSFGYQQGSNVRGSYFNNSQNNNFHYKTHQPMKSLHISSNFKCPLCNQDHGIYNCKNFLEMPNDQKLRIVNKLKLCVNCLFSHNSNPCTSTKTCRKCNSKHSSLLHDACMTIRPLPTETSPLTGKIAKRHENATNSAHVSQNDYTEILLTTAMLQVKSSDGSYIKLRALIDQGSQISLISEDAAQKLGIKRQRCKGTVFGVGQKENSCKGMINIECSSLYNDFTFNTEVLIMNNLIKNLPNNTFSKPSWKFIEELDLADPEFYKSRPVDLLFGADIYTNIILSGIIKKDETLPIAQQTQLGWLLCGHTKTKTYHCNVILNNTKDLERFWEIEEITETSNLSVQEQECMTFYNTTTVRKEDGRYEVRLPIKPDIRQKLGSTKQMSIAQFKNLERKFERQQQLAQAYKTFMREYESLNHMEVDKEQNRSSLECYLPHHGVEKM